MCIREDVEKGKLAPLPSVVIHLILLLFLMEPLTVAVANFIINLAAHMLHACLFACALCDGRRARSHTRK